MKRSKLLLLLIPISFALFLSTAGESGEIRSPTEGQEQAEPADKKADVTKNAPPVSNFVIVNNPPAEKQENGAPKESERWPPLWSIVGALFITAVATRIALQTLGGIKEQAIATRELVALERPWIMIQAHWPVTGDPIQKITWQAINAGRSPAFITRLSMKVDLIPLPLPQNRPNYPDPEPFGEFIIAPNGGNHGSESLFAFELGRQGEYHRGQICVAFYGRINYHDSNKSPHVTRFCVFWLVQNGNGMFSP